MSKLLITIGLMAMLAFSLVLFAIFASAYFSPAKAVNVKVNALGEADVEMALLSLLLPVSIAASVITTKKLGENDRETYILSDLERNKKVSNTVDGGR